MGASLDRPASGRSAQKPQSPLEPSSSSGWTEEEAKRFYGAFHRAGRSWLKVAKAVGKSKAPEACESLFNKHQVYLSLAHEHQNETAFAAMAATQHDQEVKRTSSCDTLSEDDAGNGSVLSASNSQRKAGDRRGSRQRRASNRLQFGEDFVTDGLASSRPSTSRGKAMDKPLHDGADEARGADALMTLAALAASSEERAPSEPISEEQPPVSRKKRAREPAMASPDRSVRRKLLPPTPRADPLRSPGQRMRHATAASRATTPRSETFADVDASDTPRTSRRPVRQAAVRPRARYDPSEEGAQRRTPNKPPHPSRMTNRAMAQSRSAAPGDGLDHFAPDGSGDQVMMDTPDDLMQEDQDAEGLGRGPLNWHGDEPGMPSGSEGAGSQGFGDIDDEGTPSWQRAILEDGDVMPMPRQRRRKAAPEKAPPMMSPIKSLFGRRVGSSSFGSATSIFQSIHQANAGSAGLTTEPARDPMEPMRESEVRLRRMLGPRARRWALYEFFCSALDRPWLMRSELQEFLHHLGLPFTRLLRPEWALLRSALGQPRRLSLAFLRQERAKLEAYREAVRAKYEEVGLGNETPADLPKPLWVGQAVTARHPITRQIHEGSVLTVNPNHYRVQFFRRELGTEIVKDVDVMPVDPTDNLPPALLAMQPTLVLNGRSLINGLPRRRRPGRIGLWEDPGPARGPAAGRAQQEARAAAAAAAKAAGHHREADVQALVEVTGALERKEALMAQVRQMSDEAGSGKHIDGNGGHSEDFQQAYARAVLELRKVNELLEHSLIRMQGRHSPEAEQILRALHPGLASTEQESVPVPGTRDDGLVANLLTSSFPGPSSSHMGQVTPNASPSRTLRPPLPSSTPQQLLTGPFGGISMASPISSLPPRAMTPLLGGQATSGGLADKRPVIHPLLQQLQAGSADAVEFGDLFQKACALVGDMQSKLTELEVSASSDVEDPSESRRSDEQLEDLQPSPDGQEVMNGPADADGGPASSEAGAQLASGAQDDAPTELKQEAAEEAATDEPKRPATVQLPPLGLRPGGKQDKRLRELLGGCIATLLALQYNLGPSRASGSMPFPPKTEDGAPAEPVSQPSMQLLTDAVEKLSPVHPSNQGPFAAIQATMAALRTAVAAP
ncbi:hypothetical protein WJX84_002502 [Apatococcus fuscideae]|uniref:DIRP domain-containing protein n=1 Tax=Apatococcus fuscideae TaxID=2026836 RepID=A0AAW1TI79_9CHLO